MKVLLTLNHAPHYRELFLRGLGEECDLTVLAKPCATANLIEPIERLEYTYIEKKTFSIFKKLGLQLSYVEWKTLNEQWDIIILSWDIHHILRYIYFIFNSKKKKILWMGHIYGSKKTKFLNYFRRYFLNKSAGVLTYSEEIVERLKSDGITVPVWSFNNSEVSVKDFHEFSFNFIQDKLKLLYVGRYQKRKQLERLVELAKRNNNVDVRIAGNGVKELLNIYPKIKSMQNIELFGETLNTDLEKHMVWCDIIANPGHLGLLVVNGARFGRGIIVDSGSQHAPEVIVAKDAEQFFVNWDSNEEVDDLISMLINNRGAIQESTNRIVSVVKSKYTIENMVNVFVKGIFG